MHGLRGHDVPAGQLRRREALAALEDAERRVLVQRHPQGAQHLLHNVAFLPSWPSEDRRTRIVFIVQNIPAQVLEEMVTLLDRVAVRTAAAKERGRTQSG